MSPKGAGRRPGHDSGRSFEQQTGYGRFAHNTALQAWLPHLSCYASRNERTCFMSCPVIAVIWEPNIEGRVTCDARDLTVAPERTERALPRENADPAADARRVLPSGTDLRGSHHRELLPDPAHVLNPDIPSVQHCMRQHRNSK